MRTRLSARVNVKLLVILVVIVGVLGAAAVVGYKIRKRTIAKEALEAGQAALAQQDWSEACRHLKLYLSKYPDDVDVLRDYAEASLAVRPATPESLGTAVSAYRRLLRFLPGDDEISHKLASLYFRAMNFSEAAYICRQRLKVAPEDVDARLVLARSVFRQNKADRQNVELLEGLIKDHPDQIDPYLMLADIALARESQIGIEQAQQWLDQCVNSNPQSAKALAGRARFRFDVLKDREAARADLEAAERLGPRDPGVLFLLCDLWMIDGDSSRVEALLEVIARIDPSTLADFDLEPEDLLWRRFQVAARLALRKGEGPVAVEVANAALRELPERLQTGFLPAAIDLYLLGGQQADAEKCLAEYSQAMEKRLATDPLLSDRLAVMRAAVARFDPSANPFDTIRELKGVITRNQLSAEHIARARKFLADAYMRSGQKRLGLLELEEYAVLVEGDDETARQLAKAYIGRDRGKALRYALLSEQIAPGDLDAVLTAIEVQIDSDPGDAASVGRHRQLAEKLKALLAEHPNSTRIHILLSRVAAATGEPDRALAQLEAASTACDDPYTLAMEIYRQALAQGRRDQAREALERAIQLQPETAMSRLLLAKLYESDGKVDDARRVLTEAIPVVREPDRLTVRAALSQLIVSSGDREQGIAMLESLADEYPLNAQLRLTLLRLSEVRSDPARMQSRVDQLRAIEGDKGLLWPVEQVRLWLTQPDWRVHRQQIEEMMERCVENDPSNPEPVLLLGGMHELLGNDVQAEEIYRRAARSLPVHVGVLQRLLMLLERQGRFGEAEQVLGGIPARLLPLFRPHRVGLAVGTGDLKRAKEELEQELALNPEDPGSLVLLAQVIYALEKNVDRALELLRKAESIVPDFTPALATQVRILHNEGRKDEAEKLLNTSVEQRNDFATVLMRAEYLVATQQYDLAEKDYLRLPTFEGYKVRGMALLGDYYQNRGRYEKALATWEEAVAEGPEYLILRRRMVAQLLSMQGREDMQKRGRQMLDQMLTELPNDSDLLTLKSIVLLQDGSSESVEQARGILEQVVKLAPRNVKAHLLLINAYERSAKPGIGELIVRAVGENPEDAELLLAQARYEAFQGHPGAAGQLARRVITLDPQDTSARRLLADLLFEAGDVASADEINNEILKIRPDDEAAHLARASILAARNETDQAVEYLETYLRSRADQTSVKVLLALADLYQKEKDFQSAADRLDQAVELNANGNVVFTARLRLLAAQGRYDDVLNRVNQHLVSAPEDQEVMLNGASVLVSAGQERYLLEGRRLFERLLTLAPSNINAGLGLAQTCYILKDHAAAEDAYRKVLKVDSGNAKALNDLAWIIGMERGDTEQAIELANQGIDRHPNDPHLLDTRGALLVKLERWAKARRDLQACVSLTGYLPSTQASSLCYLAKVDIAENQPEAARKHLERALELHKQFGVLSADREREARELLRSLPSPTTAAGA